MYRNLKLAVVIPCYNEEKLAEKTIATLPEFVDYIIPINDGSKDKTLDVLHKVAKTNKKVSVLDNDSNGGIGFTIKRGFKYALEHTDASAIGVVSGDAQCDPHYIHSMLDEFIDKHCDYVKGTRFIQQDALKSMPAFRRAGNIFISLLTKFSTGYYSVSDATMGYGFLRRSTLEQLDFSLVKNRYDYDTSLLVALSIISARIKEISVPAIYGEETSSIDFWPTVYRVLRVVLKGFWQRIYYKYILYSLHPIVLFMFGGLLLSAVGWLYAIYLLTLRLHSHLSPSTGTVMLAVLPIILGFQLLLTAITMDVNNEERS